MKISLPTIRSTLVQRKRNLDRHGETAVGELIRLRITEAPIICIREEK